MIDYEVFCGSSLNDRQSNEENGPNIVVNSKEQPRITVETYQKILQNNEEHVLVDVRTEPEIEICSLENAINIPLENIQEDASLEKIYSALNTSSPSLESSISNRELHDVRVVLVCRRGNDSQIASRLLREKLLDDSDKISGICKNNRRFIIQDIIGGLYSWSRKIDSDFPIY